MKYYNITNIIINIIEVMINKLIITINSNEGEIETIKIELYKVIYSHQYYSYLIWIYYLMKLTNFERIFYIYTLYEWIKNSY